MLNLLVFLESDENKSMSPASDPAMALATALGESNIFGPVMETRRFLVIITCKCCFAAQLQKVIEAQNNTLAAWHGATPLPVLQTDPLR